MARQTASKDSPLKTSSKKANQLAAAKAMLDLEEEFSSERTKAQIEPAAVDASPVQIPKQSIAVPALILAPPSPTAQDIQESAKKLPATVTVPLRSYVLPPPQEPVHDALLVPTIRSRLNYDTIPIQYAYFLDIEDFSSKDVLRSHGELLSKNRRHRRRLVRKIKELNVWKDFKKA